MRLVVVIIKEKYTIRSYSTKILSLVQFLKNDITILHIVEGKKKFVGGYDFLLKWYLNRVKELNVGYIFYV